MSCLTLTCPAGCSAEISYSGQWDDCVDTSWRSCDISISSLPGHRCCGRIIQRPKKHKHLYALSFPNYYGTITGPELSTYKSQRTLHPPFLTPSISNIKHPLSIANMSFPIPTGSYVIMNATAHTYLNVLTFNPVPGAIVCSVRNHLGNDIVHFPRARRGALDS